MSAEEVFGRLAPPGATPPWEGVADLDPGLASFIEHGLAEVLGGPGLDLRTRQLVTIAVLAAAGGCEPQLAFHVGGALRIGVPRDEVVAAVTQVSLYSGIPRVLNALAVVRKVFAEHGLV
ncbi:carboxymuconolactone decarboxylase family protein [Actinosynnema sp. NPDC053489]|uniref:carboxymuconolactone decarboxylase family protein n=1 Tax=Actinosynnema sp. NPDC053489 TaxID=3363916 RepID=UPI0037C54D0F